MSILEEKQCTSEPSSDVIVSYNDRRQEAKDIQELKGNIKVLTTKLEGIKEIQIRQDAIIKFIEKCILVSPVILAGIIWIFTHVKL